MSDGSTRDDSPAAGREGPGDSGASTPAAREQAGTGRGRSNPATGMEPGTAPRDDGSLVPGDEYAEVMASLRHYSRLRFTALTVFSGVTGAVVYVLFNNPDTSRSLVIALLGIAIVISLVFLVVERTVEQFMTQFGEKALELRPSSHWGRRPGKWDWLATKLIPVLFLLIAALWTSMLLCAWRPGLCLVPWRPGTDETAAAPQGVENLMASIEAVARLDQALARLHESMRGSRQPVPAGGLERLGRVRGFASGREDVSALRTRQDVAGVAEAIRRRLEGQPPACLLLIGSADRQPLGGALRRRYGSNSGLAHRRALAVKADLVSQLGPLHERVLTAVAAPADAPGATPGLDPGDDRYVDVYLCPPTGVRREAP